jgi:hypothetical protein
VDDYAARYGLEGDDEAFGSWGEDAVDGLAYQERVRREWCDRSSTPTF